jgi:hypothetical protein
MTSYDTDLGNHLGIIVLVWESTLTIHPAMNSIFRFKDGEYLSIEVLGWGKIRGWCVIPIPDGIFLRRSKADEPQ